MRPASKAERVGYLIGTVAGSTITVPLAVASAVFGAGIGYLGNLAMTWAKHRPGPRGRQWDNLRTKVLREEPDCYLRVPTICTYVSTEVDHVIPRFEGGTDDRSNLRGICNPCHSSKSAGEAHRAKRSARRPEEPPPGLRHGN